MMNFDQLVDERCNAIKETLINKAKEYASDQDRFHNFNVVARIFDTTPEKALMGMMAKQLVSVMDMVEWTDSDPTKLSRQIIDEKINDSICYLILLEGLLKD